LLPLLVILVQMPCCCGNVKSCEQSEVRLCCWRSFFFRFLHLGAMAGVMDGRPGTNNKSD
jgi:hypothetical protein